MAVWKYFRCTIYISGSLATLTVGFWRVTRRRAIQHFFTLFKQLTSRIFRFYCYFISCILYLISNPSPQYPIRSDQACQSIQCFRFWVILRSVLLASVTKVSVPNLCSNKCFKLSIINKNIKRHGYLTHVDTNFHKIT